MNADIALRAYILLLHAKTARDGFPASFLKKGTAMTTPAEITKLTEQARRAKALMNKTTTVQVSANKVMTNYEKTLSNFSAHVDRISKEDAALAAMMAEMGNAAPEIENALNGSTEAKPAETAHLNEKK